MGITDTQTGCRAGAPVRAGIGQWPKRCLAGAAFAEARNGNPEAVRNLDIWTYRHLRCVVDTLLDRDENARASDADAILSIALKRVEAGRDTIIDPSSYASWVSVVGRNAYLNYRRSRPRLRMVQEADLSYDAEPHLDASLDRALLQDSVCEAIERLPSFLRAVARMRLDEDWSYDAISAVTGKSKPTIRSYVNKAVERLRRDPVLTRLLREQK